MTAQILNFDGVTRHDIPASQVLDAAKNADLSPCIVLGFTESGEFYFAGSMADGGDAMWLMEQAKYQLLKQLEE